MAHLKHVLNLIPSRISPDVVFSEDEDEYSSCSQASIDNEIPTKVKKDEHSGTATSSSTKRMPLAEKKISPLVRKEDSKTLVNLPFQCKSQSYNLDEVFANTMSRILALKGLKSADGTIPQILPKKSKLPVPIEPQKKDLKTSQKSGSQELSTSKVYVINNNIYNVLSLLGTGASCKVYSAFSQSSKAIVAVKHVDLEKADRTFIDGFKKEISYLKLLQDCDDVIKMYDFEQRRHEIFIVLEKGDTDLASFLQDAKKKQNISPIMIKFYWLQMLRAVSAIHKHNIIHSDLKPANFLLVAGHLKLIDFGIAASVPTDSTSVIRDNLVGTINYMSPEAVQSYCTATEQQQGPKVSVKSDVWSLGCILYNLVYGHTPFQQLRTTHQKIDAIINAESEIAFPPIKNCALMDVLQKCLQRNTKKRASVTELLKHPYLTDEEQPSEGAAASNLRDLLSQIKSLTPQRMKAASKMIKELAQDNKNEKEN